MKPLLLIIFAIMLLYVATRPGPHGLESEHDRIAKDAIIDAL